MANNTVYDNFFLSNEIEDQFKSHLELSQFCLVDDSLNGGAGMTKKIHRYRAADGTEKLEMGAGNTKTISAGFTEREYRVQMAQNRFIYFDEEAMSDENVVNVGVRHAGTDLFNHVNSDIYAAYNDATLAVVAPTLNFDGFVDGAAMLQIEQTDGEGLFAFVNPADMARLRKSLKEELKYAEAYARKGYVGTVGGINVFVSRIAEAGTVIIAARDAVTLFHKRGIEVEQEREGNTRKNTVYSRKYYLAALTDETRAVKLLIGSAAVSGDTSVSSGKTYYAPTGLGFVRVTPEGSESPKTKGWYEVTAA